MHPLQSISPVYFPAIYFSDYYYYYYFPVFFLFLRLFFFSFLSSTVSRAHRCGPLTERKDFPPSMCARRHTHTHTQHWVPLLTEPSSWQRPSVGRQQSSCSHIHRISYTLSHKILSLSFCLVGRCPVFCFVSFESARLGQQLLIKSDWMADATRKRGDWRSFYTFDCVRKERKRFFCRFAIVSSNCQLGLTSTPDFFRWVGDD